MQDPYQILGVSRTATDDEITFAYKKLARKYHPDLNPGDKAAERKMQEINAAYDTIKDIRSGKKADTSSYGSSGSYGNQGQNPYGNPYGGYNPFGWNPWQGQTGGANGSEDGNESWNGYDPFGWQRRSSASEDDSEAPKTNAFFYLLRRILIFIIVLLLLRFVFRFFPIFFFLL